MHAERPPLEELIEHVDSVFWVMSPVRVLAYASPAFERIWGRPVEAVLGPLDAFLATVHPEDLSALEAWVEEGIARRDRRVTEYRILRPDGEVRWIRTRAVPLAPHPDGEPRFAGLSDDITEHRLHEVALEEASRRLACTFESLHEAVFIVDTPSRRVADCNAAATRIFGYPREELVGAPTRILHVSDATSEAFGRESRDVLLAEGVYRTEFAMRRADGTIFESEHTVSLLDPSVGEEGGVVSVVRDISAEKDLERRLIEAQRLEAVGRLAGGVAHDFNNLLTVIRSNAELLWEEATLSSDQRGLLDDIRAASRRGADVTSQLLAFSRRQVLQPRPMQLASVLRGMEALLGRLMGEDVRISLAVAPHAGVVEVDQSRLEQAIMNLAVNARQAMPRGGELGLTIRGAEPLPPEDRQRFPGAGPGAHVILEVRDTGEGMAPGTLARIFEPFFTTRASEGGTGLGLPSVYGTITQSGGEIAVESEVGRGTTFFIRLPTTERPPEELAPRPAPPVSARGGETILLVEDEPAVRRALARNLERTGYVVMAAASSEEALEQLAEGGVTVDLCLTDMVLPGRSGLELVETLREQHPGLPALLMSGYSEERLAASPERLADLPFLHKPFGPKELAHRLRELLDGEGGGDRDRDDEAAEGGQPRVSSDPSGE